MKIGCIGLGSLGRAIAQRLINTDHDVIVWNRTASKADGLGVPVAESPQSVGETCDTIIINLFDSPAVNEVAHRSDGLLRANLGEKLVIDTTTQFDADVRALHTLFGRAGAVYLEAPIFGSVKPTLEGAVTIVASGSDAAFIRAKPILDTLARHVFHFPQPSMATRMKLLNNLVLGAFMATIAEAVAGAEAVGISRKDALEVLSVGAGNSAVLNAKKQKLLDGDYEVHFSCDAIFKDLSGMLQLAGIHQQPTIMASAARELFALARQQELGTVDLSAVIRPLQRQE